MELSLVCKWWRNQVWAEVYRHLSLRFADWVVLCRAWMQIQQVQVEQPNFIYVKDLFISMQSEDMFDLFKMYLICKYCTNMDKVAAGQAAGLAVFDPARSCQAGQNHTFWPASRPGPAK